MAKRGRGTGTIIFALAFLLLIAYAGIAMEPYFNPAAYVRTDMLKVNDNTIIIGKGCKAIVADTTAERADAIRQGQEGVIEFRPSIYDNFAQVLKDYNVTLEAVLVEKYDGDFYYSDLLFRTQDKVTRVDSKPSDAFALALRTGAPIYINATLFDEIGEKVC